MKFLPFLAIIGMALVTNSFAKQDEPSCEQAASNVIQFRPRATNKNSEAATPVLAAPHDNVEYLAVRVPAFTHQTLLQRHIELVIYDYDGEPMKWNAPARF